ncbi:MAG: Gldg family protein, partial [Lysobacterales bacterium]
MEQKNRTMYSVATLVLLGVLFVALTILSTVYLKGMRVDLTQHKLYTLSKGTLHILKNMDEPVKFTLYFSEDASRDLPQFRSYARWAEEMLQEFADRSGGKLTLNRVNPEPFSPEEDQAARYGLQAAPVGNAGDTLYFGLVGTNSLDGQQVIPFLQPDKEKFLEYDLARMVSSLSHPKHKKVGVISGLEIGPGFDPTTQRMRKAWVIYQQLGQLFDLQNISPGAESLPDDLDLLIVIHPKNLKQPMLYAIDQYVLGGGHLLAFMDPLAEADTGGNPDDPMSRVNAGGSSTLGVLLKSWGVAYDPTKVIGDRAYALQVSMGPGRAPVRHLGVLSVKSDGINATDVASADLEVLNFSSTGWLTPLKGASTGFETLVESSKAAAPIDASRLRFLADPEDLEADFEPTGDRYTLVARITGKAKSAFSKAPEGVNGKNRLGASVKDGINVVLFADTDFLSDRLWVQKQNFLGQTVVSSFADNGTLVANLAEQLLGTSDLIGIRARASTNR